MIVTLLIKALVGLVFLLVDAVGALYKGIGLPTQFGDAITYFGSAMYGYNQFYPISELFVAFKFFITLEAGIFVWNAVWWMYGKIRGSTAT